MCRGMLQTLAVDCRNDPGSTIVHDEVSYDAYVPMIGTEAQLFLVSPGLN